MSKKLDIVNPENDSRYRDYWETYHSLMSRRGVSPDIARAVMRTNTTAIGAVMVQRGEADSLICGTFGQFRWHHQLHRANFGQGPQSPRRPKHDDPRRRAIVYRRYSCAFRTHTGTNRTDCNRRCSRHVKRFGLQPNIAFCAQSQFGNLQCDTGIRLRAAMSILDAQKVDFTYEGEMNVDAALDPELRERLLPHGRMKGDRQCANLWPCGRCKRCAQYPQDESRRA